MSDFFQNGVVANLPRLGQANVMNLEAQLDLASQERKVVLILPALYSEFEGPAMEKILAELAEVTYLHRIFLSLDRATAEEFSRVRCLMNELATPVSILWNDGPRMSDVIAEAERYGWPSQRGKGRGVWLAMGCAMQDSAVGSLVFHDCDIVSYRREMAARLAYPVTVPTLDYEYCKGYYPRVSDRLYGRANRLFLTPLLRSLRVLYPQQPLLRFLDSFRYALAGEFACSASLARRIRLAPNWGLEIGLLGEVYRLCPVDRICQVELTDNYEHKHQDLGDDVEGSGLMGMSRDIARSLLRLLTEVGERLDFSQAHCLPTVYGTNVRSMSANYRSLAAMNGLRYDLGAELKTGERFARVLQGVVDENVRGTLRPAPLLPAWADVEEIAPDLVSRLTEAVRVDNETRLSATTSAFRPRGVSLPAEAV